MSYLAHSKTELHPEGQLLSEHLQHVSSRAALCFSSPFLSECARLLGLYHDAGKYKQEFQRHLLDENAEKVDHATIGANLIGARLPGAMSPLLAMPIMGHHGGIPDGHSISARGRSMEARLQDPLPSDAVAAFLQEMHPGTSPLNLPPPGLKASRETRNFEWYMAIHMLHSSLVDADFLDTEEFYQPEQAALRGKRPSLDALYERYESYMSRFLYSNSDAIGAIRTKIQRQCVDAASGEQGFFTLSVPTGGGKTLSSLGFALHHAMRHKNIKRIIYAIPFTSIIEQNAQVFRDVLGDDAVLEHHSAVNSREQGGPIDRASENWDAPLIVTTNVQLFESLFSNKPSRCRKLHNMRDSVIILDEMQALPDALLKPCLMALHSLVTNHGATVVICTATQPDYRRVWPEVPRVTEIMQDVDSLFDIMHRTNIVTLGTLDDDALLQSLLEHEQVLCIVNNRQQARSLYEQLGFEAGGAYHLSTLMCAEHRTQKLALIRQRLNDGQRVRLISTSLIEAGVDVDFPVVYRAAAGLDSIAQAAGRCNRNMRRPVADVYVFTCDQWRAPGETERLGSMVLKEITPDHPNLLSRDALAHFFRLRFGAAAQLDKPEILKSISECRSCAFPFASIAESFNMIQSAGEPVFIRYNGIASGLIDQLEYADSPGAILRKLQRYCVSLYSNQINELQSRCLVKRIGGVLVLDVTGAQQNSVYTAESGLDPSGSLAFEML